MGSLGCGAPCAGGGGALVWSSSLRDDWGSGGAGWDSGLSGLNLVHTEIIEIKKKVSRHPLSTLEPLVEGTLKG
ncbi:hypothetical protein GCM10022267_38970 [Lentzea roselyniae]|uniref:Uncharacterized protein n=1 Tax=Lentzea roselyniae TaxID=531940 RepID=A0ABP7B547_9PSEU